MSKTPREKTSPPTSPKATASGSASVFSSEREAARDKVESLFTQSTITRDRKTGKHTITFPPKGGKRLTVTLG